MSPRSPGAAGRGQKATRMAAAGRVSVCWPGGPDGEPGVREVS